MTCYKHVTDSVGIKFEYAIILVHCQKYFGSRYLKMHHYNSECF